MARTLAGKRVAVMAAGGVAPDVLDRVLEVLGGAEGEVVVLSPGGGTRATEHGTTTAADAPHAALRGADPRRFLALVLPGGPSSVRALAENADAIAFVRAMMAHDKAVAAIGDAVELLVRADAVRGRTLAAAPTLRTSIVDAGGEWVDRPVVVDQRLVTSRTRDDLPVFCEQMLEVFTRAAASRAVDESSEESFPASDAPAWGPSSIGADRDDEHRARPSP
ncbi:MAG TPA: DJ-1/PfpI family protein [Gemmatimonadaceae bacterium]|nr:DJ-1/PfpI family protein [Gemmatimonadaceae bacterium]